MGIIEIILIGVGLSMDAFAVSICKGLSTQRLKPSHYLIIGAWFGGFQALMPAIGYLLGATFEKYITAFDHWIAFAVLVFIGARMVCGAFGKQDDEEASALCRLNTAKTILALAIATSLDALLVGVALSLTDTPFWLTILTLSVCVFGTSCTGFWLGAQLGRRVGKIMEALGGVALAGIGTKLLLGGLGIW